MMTSEKMCINRLMMPPHAPASRSLRCPPRTSSALRLRPSRGGGFNGQNHYVEFQNVGNFQEFSLLRVSVDFSGKSLEIHEVSRKLMCGSGSLAKSLVLCEQLVYNTTFQLSNTLHDESIPYARVHRERRRAHSGRDGRGRAFPRLSRPQRRGV